MTSFLGATAQLARRSIREFPRVPSDLVIALLIPLFFFALLSLQLSAVTRIPGFPSDSYARFLLPQILVFTAFTSANGAGYGLVLEVKNGYLDKLLAAPIPRSSILLGRLAANGVRSMGQVGVVLLIATIFGLAPVTGLLGVIVILLICAGLSIAWAGMGAIVALLTRSPEATEGLTILFLPLTYVTTGSMPREFLPVGMQKAVMFNPITYVIEGLRALTMTGWNAGAIALAFVAVISIGIVTISGATWALRRMDA